MERPPSNLITREGLIDPWAGLGTAHWDREAERSRALEYFARHQGSPRVTELAHAFIEQDAPPGKVLLYGAGTHSDAMLPAFRSRPDISIVAVADKLARPGRVWQGFPMVAPEDARGVAFDYVFTAHTSFEGEMARRITNHGVPADRIVPLYTHPAYVRRARRWTSDAVAITAGRRYDSFVITCSNESVVPFRRIESIVPRETTLHIYMGRPGYLTEEGGLERLIAHESLDVLEALLTHHAPKAVYLSSWVIKNYLAAFVKSKHPTARLIFDMYDVAALWSDDGLQTFLGLDQTSSEMLRIAEYFGVRDAELVISKRGGEKWRLFEEACKNYICYYPMVDGHHDPASRDATPVRLVYAGQLPPPEYADSVEGYNFLPVLESLTKDGRFTVDIFNATHLSTAQDAAFQEYLTKYSTGPIKYHRRESFATLRKKLSSFDLAWLCGEHWKDEQLERIAIFSNTLAGYVAADLPVVIDSGWTLGAEMISRFGAGVVVTGTDADAIATGIASVNLNEARMGARRLHKHLATQNGLVIGQIIQTLDSGEPIRHRASRPA